MWLKIFSASTRFADELGDRLDRVVRKQSGLKLKKSSTTFFVA